jgi:hypothetical protein
MRTALLSDIHVNLPAFLCLRVNSKIIFEKIIHLTI